MNEFPCDIITIKEGEQAGRKVELEIKSDVEEVIIKIILYMCKGTCEQTICTILHMSLQRMV